MRFAPSLGTPSTSSAFGAVPVVFVSDGPMALSCPLKVGRRPLSLDVFLLIPSIIDSWCDVLGCVPSGNVLLPSICQMFRKRKTYVMEGYLACWSLSLSIYHVIFHLF